MEQEVRATTKGAIEMMLEYVKHPQIEIRFCFREIKVISKYFFKAVVGLERIQRLMAG